MISKVKKRLPGMAQISMLMPESKKTPAIALFIFFTGISAGIFLEIAMPEESKLNTALFLKEYIADPTNEISYPNPFIASATGNLTMLAVIFFSGLSYIGFPVAFAGILYKGVSLGFCTGLLFESLGSKAVVTVLTTILPQNIIIIPLLLLAAILAVNYALTGLQSRRFQTKKSRINLAAPYIGANVLIGVGLLLGCLIEAILYPIVL